MPLVLVVDDDMTVRFLAREVLEQSGFRVEEADDGVPALSVFTAHPPDIVLLDVMMPTMDGFATCAALRAQPGGAHIPILMMTGLDDMDSINRAYEAGATDFAVKPINWTILSHRVRYMLRASNALQAVKASEARLANAQRIAQLGHWEWRPTDNYWQCSEQVCHVFGLSQQNVQNYQHLLERTHPDDRAEINQLRQRAAQEGHSYNLEYRVFKSGEKTRIVHEQAEVTRDASGRVQTVAGTLQDITERRRAEEQIRYLAYFDTLTGLPNRQAFIRDLQKALEIAKRHNRLLAVIVLDLDNFKRINDTLGHAMGDFLLKAVAERLVSGIRCADYVARNLSDVDTNVARLGGDEFTMLLTEVQHIRDVEAVAQRLREMVSQPLNMAGNDVVVTPSMGIAVFPHDGQDVDQLLKNADMAMYHAKDSGRNIHQFYSESMNIRALERLNLESRLRKALDQEEFLLYYQPQLDLQSNQIIGVEALIRWQNPKMGLVSPADFIPLAEETGLIVAIGEWALYTACAQVRTWLNAGLPPLEMAVNLSSVQFRQSKLTHTIEQAIKSANIAPQHLKLELTESMIMHQAQDTIAMLHQFKEMGVGLSVDDFGTGYSSLSYLKRFPLDTLKIDRSFVKDITSDPDDAAITNAIIAMAHSLNLSVVAEGVETQQQLEFLRANRCDTIQGYLLSKPLPAEALAPLFQNKPKFIAGITG
jgi:diguanylate cyclase (GGDEF)-like protein/PAS domain S-box-containing protein